MKQSGNRGSLRERTTGSTIITGLGLLLFSLELPSTASGAFLTQLPEPVLQHGAAWDHEYAGTPEVVHVGGVYYMFYFGHAWGGSSGDWDNIALATSTNGVNWTKVGPVVQATLPWEDGYVVKPTVVYLNGTFHMWYRGGLSVPGVGYAQSTNGVTWAKHPSPVLTARPGSFDSQAVAESAVIWRDGKFHMLYDAANDSSTWQVGYAWSSDGTNWIRRDAPVSGLPANAASGDMALSGPQTFMVYHKRTGGTNNIGLAASVDFVNWTDYPGNPILVPVNSWEVGYVAAPCLLLEGGRFKLWYTGGNYGPPRDIGYAEGAMPSWLNLDFIARLTLYGPIGGNCRIEFSNDLNTWTMLTNLTLTVSPYEYADWTSPGTPKRFYRIIWLP